MIIFPCLTFFSVNILVGFEHLADEKKKKEEVGVARLHTVHWILF